MVSKLALFSNLLLASVATMVVPPSQLGARLARGEGLQSQPSNRDVSESNESDDSSVGIVPDATFVPNWAGAQVDRLPFMIVTGSFTVPTASLVEGGVVAGANIWVGVGGKSLDPNSGCNVTVMFLTGLQISFTNGQFYYEAFWQWYPDKAYNFPVAGVTPGDDMLFIVSLTDASDGTAFVMNRSRGWSSSQGFTSAHALCVQNALWIVEDYVESGAYIPFPKLGGVIFINTGASRKDTLCHELPGLPSCDVGDAAVIYDIVQQDVRFTFTFITPVPPPGRPQLLISDLRD